MGMHTRLKSKRARQISNSRNNNTIIMEKYDDEPVLTEQPMVTEQSVEITGESVVTEQTEQSVEITGESLMIQTVTGNVLVPKPTTRSSTRNKRPFLSSPDSKRKASKKKKKKTTFYTDVRDPTATPTKDLVLEDCPVCTNKAEFVIPDCLHLICKDCYHKLRHNCYNGNGKFICPTCRQDCEGNIICINMRYPFDPPDSPPKC